MSGTVGFDAWGDGPPVSSVDPSVTFRTCYISHDGTKGCSPQYVHDWLASGRHIIFNFEDTSSISGRDGNADALFAQAQIASVYGFTNVPCIWSADSDLPDPSVADGYARAWASVFGAAKTGPYGESALINYCVNNGISQLGWLTMSYDWTGGDDPTNAGITQGGYGTIAGSSVDWDTLTGHGPDLYADAIITAPIPAPPAPAPSTSEEDDMQQIEPLSVHPGLYNFPVVAKGHFRLTVGDGGTATVRAVAWDMAGNDLVLCGDNADGDVKKGGRDFSIDSAHVSHVQVQRTDSGNFPVGVIAY